MTLYSVVGVKRNVSTWVSVDGGMSDNLRPMLYGSRYEAEIAEPAAAAATRVHLAGKHCESGDVLIRDALLDDPRPGDVLVTPATGAYGYAMANNYNGVPRAAGDLLLAAGRRAWSCGARRSKTSTPATSDELTCCESACSATAPSARAFERLLDERAGRDRAADRASTRRSSAC